MPHHRLQRPGGRTRARGAARGGDRGRHPRVPDARVGQLQALRGQITAPATDEVVLTLTDDIRLGQRRVFSRAPIPLPVQVRTEDGGSSWTTTTRDVSAGGVCVGREGTDPGDGPLALKITVASHEMACEAGIMRLTDSEIGLQFERIEDADRLLLASLALAYHRPR